MQKKIMVREWSNNNQKDLGNLANHTDHTLAVQLRVAAPRNRLINLSQHAKLSSDTYLIRNIPRAIMYSQSLGNGFKNVTFNKKTTQSLKILGPAKISSASLNNLKIRAEGKRSNNSTIMVIMHPSMPRMLLILLKSIGSLRFLKAFQRNSRMPAMRM